jgi:hypothetical protein
MRRRSSPDFKTEKLAFLVFHVYDALREHMKRLMAECDCDSRIVPSLFIRCRSHSCR